MTRPVTLGLLWHQMNSDNLGVGALTLANIEILRDAAQRAGRDIRFEILGWKDPRGNYLEADDIRNVPLRVRHLVSPKGVFAESLRRVDAVFDIGGGDSFTDIYGPKRFLTVWGSKARVLAAGKPLILCPQTIGPFESAWSRSLARQVMNRATAVVTRDTPSTQFLEDIGVTGRIVEATDVAMRLPYTQPERTEAGPLRVGLNVSGLLMSGGYTGADQFNLTVEYPALINRIMSYFSDQDGVELHLVGHVQSETQPIEDDQRAGERLKETYPNCVLAPVFKSPIEAKSYISGLDFFMGARMHATIAAFSTGVPVVPMAYSRKFRGVFETLGYDRLADMKSQSDDEVFDVITSAFKDRAALQQEVKAALAHVSERLDVYSNLSAETISAL